MTKVCFKRDGNRYEVRATGHATGSDAVCAAVSAIMYALAGWLINADDGGKAYDVLIDMSSGRAKLGWRGGAEADAVYNMVVIGLAQIAQSYPDYIQIDNKQTE